MMQAERAENGGAPRGVEAKNPRSPRVEVYRGSVQTWECDQMGHLNVQFYIERAESGIAELESRLRTPCPSPDLELVAVEQHVRFHREMRPGAAAVMEGCFLDAETRCGDLAMYLRLEQLVPDGDGLRRELSATFVIDFECRIKGRRHAVPHPWRIVQSSLCGKLDAEAIPRGLGDHPSSGRASAKLAEKLGLVPIQRSPVHRRECDANDVMTGTAIMGRLSDGIPNLILALRGEDRSKSRLGGAALEYRFRYHQPASLGDRLLVRSGLMAVDSKTRTFVHWVLNADSGLAVATAEAVAVSLDLEKRKLHALDEHEIVDLKTLVIPNLTL